MYYNTVCVVIYGDIIRPFDRLIIFFSDVTVRCRSTADLSHRFSLLFFDLFACSGRTRTISKSKTLTVITLLDYVANSGRVYYSSIIFGLFLIIFLKLYQHSLSSNP